jgi:phospholipid/cholesterol/gamma-HCH transport system permease protein
MSTLYDYLASLGYRGELFVQVLARLPSTWRRRAQVLDQFWVGGIKVLHVVLLVGFSIGMVVSLQTGIELARIGQQDQIGTLVSLTMAREMGPFITATILAAAVGSALAAELGTMAVSEELSALEVLSVDVVSYLVVPRLVGLAVLAPMLTILCDAVGIVGGGLVARSQLGIGLELYFNSAIDALQDPSPFFDLPKDVYVGLFKSFVFGLLIAVTSCAAGLKTRGGALGVGNATRSAVRDSIIVVIVFNYLMTWFFYQQ